MHKMALHAVKIECTIYNMSRVFTSESWNEEKNKESWL